MANTCFATAIHKIAKAEMKGSHCNRKKPILSLGRRMGRKGDPRMHNAVNARLDDPNISLFHALKLGGFNYLDDIDGKAVDEENVTLAQRKNQLSRRLRMRLTEIEAIEKRPPTCQEKLDDLVEAQKHTFQELLRQNTSGSSVASVDSFGSTTEAESIVAATESTCIPHREEPQDAQKRGASMEPVLNEKTRRFSISGHSEELQNSFPAVASRASPMNEDEASGTASLCSEYGLRSLNQTAKGLGLTLDQLALVLSSTDNLSELLGVSKKRDQMPQFL